MEAPVVNRQPACRPDKGVRIDAGDGDGLGASAAELRRVAAQFYEHLCLTFVEIVRLPYWSRERVLAASAEHAGEEHLEAALAEGKGAILITGHIGNWEMAGAMLGLRGYR